MNELALVSEVKPYRQDEERFEPHVISDDLRFIEAVPLLLQELNL